MHNISIFLIFLTLGHWVHGTVRCRDEFNNPVDWYVIYKLPRLSYSSSIFGRQGKEYMFITSNNLDASWKISSQPIDSDVSLLANTVQFLKDPKTNVLWFTYNDEGDSICLFCGHSKGIIAGDENGGIWLVHSVPHYIDGIYPSNGYKFGQSAICISLSQKELNLVGELLKYNSPRFQRWNLNNNFKDMYPNILSAYEGKKVSYPWSMETLITTLNDTKLHAFAKANNFHTDLYEWVASSLQTDLYTETWRNVLWPLSSSCSLKYKVENVQTMMVPQLNLQFSSRRDHSKLAISKTSLNPWVCLGDINRTKRQKKRGGGTVCLSNTKLWQAYNILIDSVEKCS